MIYRIKDKLPEYYKPVLCYNKEKFAICWLASDGEEYFFTVLGSDDIMNNVTHWIDIPTIKELNNKNETYIIEKFLDNKEVVHISDDKIKKIVCSKENDLNNGLSIEINSNDFFKKHKQFNKFINKNIRITIETID